ncbi:glycosyltransferase [Selenomonas ruminantium]|nr:glycosyltransferase [Selenomonas ruminantium]
MDSDKRRREIKDTFRKDEFAPVVLFTYNRLDHTNKSIEALKQNVLADETELFIYSDAPKNEGAKDSVAAVREYLHSVTGFKKIEIIEREENWGLARNIIDGVTKIVNEYGRIIVLEDDIVTSPYFLQYMNDALRIYEQEPKVMAVSGYCWGKDKEDLPETFFLRWFSCWGWATWKEAWDIFERNPEKLVSEHNMENNAYYNMNGQQNMWYQVEQNLTGDLYTWAIFFYTAIWIYEGLVLYSNEDLCLNIGFDNSGEHCGEDDYGFYKTDLRQSPVCDFTQEIITSASAEKCVTKSFAIINRKSNLFSRFIKVLKREGIKGVIDRLNNKAGL